MAEENFRKKLYPDYKKKKPKKPKIHPDDVAPEVGHQQEVDKQQAVQDADMNEGDYIDSGEGTDNEGNLLQWKGIQYTNVEDYMKAVEASGASGRAGYTPGPAEAITAAYWAPKAVATYGLDKTLEVGLGALFPDVQENLLEQGLRAAKLGTAARVSRLSRIAYDKIIKDVFDFRIGNPFKVGEFASSTGTGFDTGSPKPEGWSGTTSRSVEPLLGENLPFLNQFANEVLESPRGVNIAKRKEEGYKFLGDFAKEWNLWSKSRQFIDELADRPSTAFVEHLVGKGNRLDWFWALPNEVRSWRPGSRHSPNNVRIFYSNRQKALKDATENILYKMQENIPDMDRLLVDYDIPKMEGKSITLRQPAGDVILRRVDGTIVGRLGDYHDILYAPNDVLADALTTNINPRTGTFYIDPNTGDMKRAIRKWREGVILEKLNIIISEAPTTIGKTAAETYQRQAGKVMEAGTDLLDEYAFINKPAGSTLDKTIKETLDKGGTPPNLRELLGMDPTPEMNELFGEPQGWDMLRDRLDGMDWRQLNKKYPKYNRDNLEIVLNQLTSESVGKIMKAYNLSGKGYKGKTGFLDFIFGKDK